MKKLLTTLILAIGLIAAGIFVYAFIGGGFSGSKKLASALWTHQVAGEQRLFFTTIQNQSTITGVRHMPRVQKNSRFHLVARALADGGPRGIVDLGKDQRATILGIAGGLIWLWRGQGKKFGLEGRDLASLELRLSPETIAKAYPAQAKMLPNDKKFIQVPPGGDSVVIKKLDAQRFVLSTDDEELRPYLAELAQRSGEPETQAKSLPPHLRSDDIRGAGPRLTLGLPRGNELPGYLSEHYHVTSFSLENTWYGILNEKIQRDLRLRVNAGTPGSEREVKIKFVPIPKHFSQKMRRRLKRQQEASRRAILAQLPRVPIPGRPDKNDATQIYRVAIGLTAKNAQSVLQTATAKVLGQAHYLKAGFVLWRDSNQQHPSVLILDKPHSVILLHKKTLSEDANWQLQRLGLDGAVVWQADTGLKILNYMISRRQTLILAGLSVRGGPKQTARFHMAHVATQTGTVNLRDLDTGD